MGRLVSQGSVSQYSGGLTIKARLYAYLFKRIKSLAELAVFFLRKFRFVFAIDRDASRSVILVRRGRLGLYVFGLHELFGRVVFQN